MSFWNETERAARKAHKCDECLTEIRPGDRYTRGAGINVHGDFGCWVTHTDCLAAAREQMKLGDCGYDEWWPLHEVVWDMSADALAGFALDWPDVYERFRGEFEAHDRAPDHFIWRGSPHYLPPRREQFHWWRP